MAEQIPGYKLRLGPNNVPLYYPESMSDEEIEKIKNNATTADYVKNLPTPEATAGEKTEGKIASNKSDRQMPAGPMRDIGIAGGQFVRGLASPVAIPGDIANIVREVAAVPPAAFPQTRVLPTTQGLDKAFTDVGITPNYLTPEGPREKMIAGVARGAGEGAGLLAPKAVGLAAYPLTGSTKLSRYGNTPTNLLTGGAAGGASTATEQFLEPMQDPSRSSSLAPLAPPVIGAATGLATGGAIQAGTNLYQSMRGTSPYHGVVNALGGDLSLGEPFISDAGETLQKAIRASGVKGTTLDRKTYNSLTNSKTDGNSVYNRVINDPRLAQTMRNEHPDEMDYLAGSHLANTNSRAGWLGLHPRVQGSLVPDQTQRGIVDNTFRGGVLPGNFLESMGEQARNVERKILLGVGSEAFGAASHYFAEMAHSDPSLAGGLALLGAVAPAAWMGVKSAMGSTVARQGLVGGATGLDPGTHLIPPSSMQYNAPNEFNPPASSAP